MAKLLRITGTTRLKGNLAISGSKNGCLLVMAACLLAKGKVRLTNTPQLADVASMVELMSQLGVRITQTANQMEIDSSQLTNTDTSYEVVRKMRASIGVVGPLLARKQRVRVALPGGCAIGPRPIDLHIKALSQLGAKSTLKGGDLYLEAEKLKGTDIRFKSVSMGATANALTAATLATGTTRLHNASTEPEIADLCHFLSRCLGANIQTNPTSPQYTIEGNPTQTTPTDANSYAIPPDRIETGTYAIAAAATQGKVTLTNARPTDLTALWQCLTKSGARVTLGKSQVTVEATEPLTPVDITTAPYPAFPTDLQAQWTSLAIKAKPNHQTLVTDKVFPHRFIHISELQRMGANIALNQNVAKITAVDKLSAAEVMATDLRASVALVIAALNAKGTSTIHRIYHLKRGYENLRGKLNLLGAQITEEDER